MKCACIRYRESRKQLRELDLLVAEGGMGTLAVSGFSGDHDDDFLVTPIRKR